MKNVIITTIIFMLMFSIFPVYALNGDYYLYGNLPYVRPGFSISYTGTSLVGKSSMMNVEVYKVIGSTSNGPDIHVMNYLYDSKSQGGMITINNTQGFPWSEGPFWIDPAKLRNIKRGDIFTYGNNSYMVVYVGTDFNDVKNFDQYLVLTPLYIKYYHPTFVVMMTGRNEEMGGNTGQILVVDKDRGLILSRKDMSVQNGTAITTYTSINGINYDFDTHVISWEGHVPGIAGALLRGITVGIGASEYLDILYIGGIGFKGEAHISYSVNYLDNSMVPHTAVFGVKGKFGDKIQIVESDINGNPVNTEDSQGWPLVWVDPSHLNDETLYIEGVVFYREGEKTVGGRNGVVYKTDNEGVPLPKLIYDTTNGYLIGATYMGNYSSIELGIATPDWFTLVDTVVSHQPKEKVITLKVGDTVIYVDGNKKTMDVKPQIIARWGRTVVPVRFVAEGLGAKVSWDGKERKVTIEKGDNTIYLWIDKPKAQVNNRWVWIDPSNHDVRPVIINNRTMVPLRFVAESLGVKVGWNGILRQIYLIKH